MSRLSSWRGVLAFLVAMMACSAPGDPPSQEGEHVGEVTSALSTTTHYEGEAMSWSGKNNVDGEIDPGPPVSRYFWTDGSIWTTHPFVGGPTTITLQAKGELMGGVGPHVVVSVEGTTIGSGYVNNTSFASSTYTFTATPGAKELRITYDNDDTNGIQ
ncbi:MAG: hypothetical protein FWD69_06470, partial [Polyangiaceae bacterium]|nr:hypothetical protein [Polyangiaceae bacterium]